MCRTKPGAGIVDMLMTLKTIGVNTNTCATGWMYQDRHPKRKPAHERQAPDKR